MLSPFSKTYFTPDDVSVPCRIRRCEVISSLLSKHDEDENEQMMTNLQREEEILNQPEEMTCTMRTWHKTSTPPKRKSSDTTTAATNQSSSSSSSLSGLPELILTRIYYKHRKILSSGSSSNISDMNKGGLDIRKTDTNKKPIPLSKKFASFGSSEPRSKSFGLSDNIMDQSQHTHFSISNGRSSLRQRGNGCDIQRQQQQSKEKIIISLDNIAKVHVNSDNDDRDGKNKRKSRNNGNTVTKNNEEQNHERTIGITTASSGWYYEFTMESMNEHLVLLTFLKINSSSTASLIGKTPKIEFVPLKKKKQTADDQNDNENNGDNNGKNASITHNSNGKTTTTNNLDDFVRSIELNASNLTQTTQQSNKSFDVETFTAKRMTERLKRESLSEKVERRMHRLVSSLGELSSTFTKCACGCFGDSIFTTSLAPSSFDKNHSRSCHCRNTTNSTVSLSDDDEHNNNNITANPPSRNSNNDNDTTTKYKFDDKNSNAVTVPVVVGGGGGGGSNSSSSFMKKNREELMRYAQLPSGLSVESPDDYGEYSDSLPSPRPVPILTRP
mmetsp:Transcript_4320/g.4882  ORF Transcript_4320/g.4882 Transcript_4320/m.4882 type:complete len:556 (+) Transcript_4320:142-1809(+)